MDRLVRETPSLRARMHLKYARLEARLAEALQQRNEEKVAPDRELVGKPALLAMIAVGALRLGSDAWRPGNSPSTIDDYTQQVIDRVWDCLSELAGDG